MRANRWLQVEGDLTDENSVVYKVGTFFGVLGSFALGGGAARAGASRASQLLAQTSRTYNAIGRLEGLGQSAHNVATGHGSVLDGLAFLPRGVRRGARPSHLLGFADEAQDAARRSLRKGAQERLSDSRIKQLEELMRKDGTSIHRYKGKGSGKRDFYVDKETGDIYLKPKDGSGPGERTDYNISDFDQCS